MYTVEYVDGYWRILRDGKIVEELGRFIDPISPKIIVEEITDG